MKKILVLLAVLLMALALSACHEHSWKEADCVNPKVCESCGETEGVANGHNWKDATCTEPKMCKICGITDGEPTHTWENATCVAPKTCKICGATEGNRNAHYWMAATCTAPKTCMACKTTEGSPKEHDWTAATCTKPKTCKDCGKTEGSTASHNWTNATCTTPKKCTTCGKTEGSTASHNWKAATCVTPKTCTNCGKTEGKTVDHAYASGKCESCGAADPNYVPELKAGETWVVSGKFELTINAVVRHSICDDGYSGSGYSNGNTAAVIIDYTYKNLGTDKLEINEWDFEVYGASGVEGDCLFFNNYCDHAIEAQNCISGGSCNAKLPVALKTDGDSVTVYVEKEGKTGIFKIAVTDPKPGDTTVEAGYSRVDGEITYKYNDFVGTRGDSGAKILFVPKNTALKSQDNSMAMLLTNGKYEGGIVVKTCDGYGRFDTGDNYITAGEYVVVVVSKNTTRSSAVTADQLKEHLGDYLSDADLDTLALMIGFSKVAIDSMTLEKGYVHTISHDFGITYF